MPVIHPSATPTFSPLWRFAGADPSCHWTQMGCTLDESPLQCRASVNTVQMITHFWKQGPLWPRQDHLSQVSGNTATQKYKLQSTSLSRKIRFCFRGQNQLFPEVKRVFFLIQSCVESSASFHMYAGGSAEGFSPINHCLPGLFLSQGEAVYQTSCLVLYLRGQWPLTRATMNTRMENDSLF